MTDYVAPIKEAQKLNEKEPISELPSSLFQIEEGTLSKEIAEWEPEDREKVFFQKFFFSAEKKLKLFLFCFCFFEERKKLGITSVCLFFILFLLEAKKSKNSCQTFGACRYKISVSDC